MELLPLKGPPTTVAPRRVAQRVEVDPRLAIVSHLAPCHIVYSMSISSVQHRSFLVVGDHRQANGPQVNGFGTNLTNGHGSGQSTPVHLRSESSHASTSVSHGSGSAHTQGQATENDGSSTTANSTQSTASGRGTS